MNEKDIAIFKRLYTEYATLDVKNKLKISENENAFSRGIIAGCKIGYETTLFTVMPYNEFEAFKHHLKMSLSNELKISYYEVEELLN